MDKPYEVVTDELRQVKEPITKWNGVLGPGGYRTPTGIETTIQRKWLVQTGERYEGVRRTDDDIDISPDQDARGIWLPGRAEWRDLPTEWIGEKPMARAL